MVQFMLQGSSLEQTEAGRLQDPILSQPSLPCPACLPRPSSLTFLLNAASVCHQMLRLRLCFWRTQPSKTEFPTWVDTTVMDECAFIVTFLEL